MTTFLHGFSIFLILLSILPFSKNQHWVFRVPEFLKIQILLLQIALVVISAIAIEKNTLFWVINGIQILLIIYHIYILIRYTKFYRKKRTYKKYYSSESVKVISANVYQFNTEFHRLIQLINKENPDIFVTMESNGNWENAMRVLEKKYPHQQKVTLENTYGMHLYSKIPFEFVKTHFFVANDLPSIEAHFKTRDGFDFVLFAVHPPPPSPTEEATSKERDGDLLSVAKRVRKMTQPVLVIGDFNNVAWADSSILFRKTSELIDARLGRGILSTFHSKYWFFRVPLDLLFHSPEVFIEKLGTLEHIGSDHFPIVCKFHINLENESQIEEVKTLEEYEIDEVNALIEEGKKEESDNRKEFATED